MIGVVMANTKAKVLNAADEASDDGAADLVCVVVLMTRTPARC